MDTSCLSAEPGAVPPGGCAPAEPASLLPALDYHFTPPRRARFLHHLAEQGNVAAACAKVRVSKQAAYLARRRDTLFRAGWDAALVLARPYAEEVLANRALDGVREAVFHRGEVVGERVRFDTRLLLAHLARLDARCGDARAQVHAARFDEMLALVAGEAFPAHMADRGEGRHYEPDPFLPMARARYARERGYELQEEAEAAAEAVRDAEDGGVEAIDAEQAGVDAAEALMHEAQRLAVAERDQWDERADAVAVAAAGTGEEAMPVPQPWTAADVSGLVPFAEAAAGVSEDMPGQDEDPAGDPLGDPVPGVGFSYPRTPSTWSTSAEIGGSGAEPAPATAAGADLAPEPPAKAGPHPEPTLEPEPQPEPEVDTPGYRVFRPARAPRLESSPPLRPVPRCRAGIPLDGRCTPFP